MDNSNRHSIVSVLFIISLAVAILFLVLDHFSLLSDPPSPQPKTYYEATLFVDDKAVFCIADVKVLYSSKAGSTYWINELLLPYGKSYSPTHGGYDPNDSRNLLSLGSAQAVYSCKIVLSHPATDASFALLDDIMISNYGPCCASKGSDFFHLSDCPHAKSIKPENLVYFSSDKEAWCLGFEMCNDCWNRL